MKKVTEYFEKYREASRHLRNIYYVPKDDDVWDILDDFEEVSVLLFKHLVCAPLNIGYEKYDWFNESISCFKLQAQGSRLPIMINRIPNVNHGHWDHEIHTVDPDDLTLDFICYFDWNPQGVIDNRYIMCKISDAKVSKNVIGHIGLVESHYVEIHHAGHS
ncbi:hypothetical protein P886_4766 [Alteromonadaceae bacterium 2753L.S.0a.02]|nr:hypothetical protein P886_3420 [Alteromonadaceae bacterium 2753L.S.0a.02]TVZ40339.1 hypothetical protein P886_4766 [Alteromonadaceae bacterium 2753L.S.0a.02]